MDEKNKIISSGWNDPPKGIDPCDKKGDEDKCEKDKKVENIKKKCLKLTKNENCEGCFDALDSLDSLDDCPIFTINKEIKFANYCKSIHAEEKALLEFARSGADTGKYTFYTTTKPCYACIKRILDMGFLKIVYQENYGDPLAKDIIDEFKDKIELKAFEGITSNSFFRYYKSFS